MTPKAILKHLPYTSPFLFVDALSAVSKEGITGHYTFNENAFFYKGHFKNRPVTPGVILTEVMAQIGVVCLGIFLQKDILTQTNTPKIALTSHHIDFYKPVLPNETVTVTSEKVYFRFQKLKCKVSMTNAKGQLVCRGTISGMITTNQLKKDA
jgi:3-hydroxyacyl-[acyl-carrier-protein] dehydratase (EC 4.2.1.-)